MAKILSVVTILFLVLASFACLLVTPEDFFDDYDDGK